MQQPLDKEEVQELGERVGGWHSRVGVGQESTHMGLWVPGTVGIPGKDAVHTALIDTTVGPGNPPDAFREACKHGALWGKMAKLSTTGIAMAALTPKPSLIPRPFYLGGDQLQVVHRLRLWEELDLLH